MTDAAETKIVSLSGTPIYRHTEETPWQLPQGEVSLEQISAHIHQYLGEVETVFHEVVSDTVHIDVHLVKPSDDCSFIRLVTSGMSDLPMMIPEGSPVPQYLELMMTLPADWKLDQSALKDEK